MNGDIYTNLRAVNYKIIETIKYLFIRTILNSFESTLVA